jgi:hypothetical protein
MAKRQQQAAAQRIMEIDKPEAQPRGGIRVRALKLGYYDDARRREGDVFTIRNEKEFSRLWMERVPFDTPERVTTGNEELRRMHDETIRARHSGAPPDNPTGSEGVLDED